MESETSEQLLQAKLKVALEALKEIAADWSDRNMTGLERSDERQRIAIRALGNIDVLRV